MKVVLSNIQLLRQSNAQEQQKKGQDAETRQPTLVADVIFIKSNFIIYY